MGNASPNLADHAMDYNSAYGKSSNTNVPQNNMNSSTGNNATNTGSNTTQSVLTTQPLGGTLLPPPPPTIPPPHIYNFNPYGKSPSASPSASSSASVPVGTNNAPITTIDTNLVLYPKVYIDGILYLPSKYNNSQYFSSATIESHWTNESQFLNINSQNCEQFRNNLLVGEHSMNVDLTNIKLPYTIYYYLNSLFPGKINITKDGVPQGNSSALILKNNNNNNASADFGKSVNTLFIDVNGKPFIYSNIISFDDIEAVDSQIPASSFVTSPAGSTANVSHIIHHFDMDFLNRFTNSSGSCKTPMSSAPAPASVPSPAYVPAPAPVSAPAPAPSSYPLNTSTFTIDNLRMMITNLLSTSPDVPSAITSLTAYIATLSNIYASNPTQSNVDVYNLTVIFINYLNNALKYLKLNDVTNAVSNLNYALITDSKLYLNLVSATPVASPVSASVRTPAPANMPFSPIPGAMFSAPAPAAAPSTRVQSAPSVSSNLNVENLRLMISNLLGPNPDIPTAVFSLKSFIQQASSIYSMVPNGNNLEIYNLIITFISLLNKALDDLNSNRIADAVKNLNSALSIDSALYVYLFSGNSYYYNNSNVQNRPSMMANSLPAIIANLKSNAPDINGSIVTIDTDMNLLVNDFRSIAANDPQNPLIPQLNLMINNILFYCEKARLDLLSSPVNVANAIHDLNNAIYINTQLIKYIQTNGKFYVSTQQQYEYVGQSCYTTK
jgi:tetratricopeptide (TPR) repeat protein